MALLKSLYSGSTPDELCAALDNQLSARQIGYKAKKLGLRKSAEYMNKYGIAENGTRVAGSVSWNKGKKFNALGRSVETQFKKGTKPPNWRPVGSTRISKDGYIEIKIAEGMHKWRLLHRENWKKHHGQYPKSGQAIIFIDGNKHNCNISNLALITRQELMLKNSVHNLPAPLKQVIQLTGALRRRVNERSKQRRQTA
ncbi:HNH endonuclease [Nitrosomonas aestuarii]|uniref:HNH endonuclease n=2 Tax=Nitrosomonas aestuarii TaxID=52441 RepID=A0A1I4C5N0_9PROT|nr:HNH endonuclease [Nitrosomonas aestuarii]